MTQERITNDLITSLNSGEVFVFGSNLSGRHGAGAAKTALKWGAIYGNGVGIQGSTYAIPTKDRNIETMSINRIKPYVDQFIEFAKNDTKKRKFFVTEIGCGLAGLKHEEIAPLFKEAVHMENIYLPKKFLDILNKQGI